MGKQKHKKDSSANNSTASFVTGIPGLYIWFKLKTKQEVREAFLQNKIMCSFLFNLFMFSHSLKLWKYLRKRLYQNAGKRSQESD